MRYHASVTLEYDTQPPQTARGEIDVPNARLGARRAVDMAFRTYPGSRWQSLVVVLEKLDAPAVSENDDALGTNRKDAA